MNKTYERTNDTAYELGEAKAELARHHKDFEKISKIIDDAVNSYQKDPSVASGAIFGWLAMTQIRNIVG